VPGRKKARGLSRELVGRGYFYAGEKDFPDRQRNFHEKWLVIGSGQLMKWAIVMIRAILQNEDTQVSAA
jgi:hypothetical protein